MEYLPQYLREGPQGEAKEDYKKLLEIAAAALITHPEDKECLLSWMAYYYYGGKQFEECIVHCKEVLPQMEKENCIRDVQSYVNYSYKALGKMDDAIEFQKELIEQLEESEYIDFDKIIKLYEEKDDVENEIKYYELMIAHENGNCDSGEFQKLAKHYDTLKDYENSCKNYELAARAQYYDGCWMWCNAGRALALMGKDNEAAFYFKMILKLDPDYANAHYFLGLIYGRNNDIYMAMHHYNEALKLKPDFPEVLNDLAAIAFNDENNIAGAIEQMEKALTMNPESYIRGVLYKNLITLYGKIVDYDKQNYYKSKIFEMAGFKTNLSDDDDKV